MEVSKFFGKIKFVKEIIKRFFLDFRGRSGYNKGRGEGDG